MSGQVRDFIRAIRAAMDAQPLEGAIMSHELPEPTYRLVLWRVWTPGANPRLLSLTMLNPSKADHSLNDPTMKSCIRLAKLLGFDGIIITNLFAYRATKPSDLKAADRIIGPGNNLWIEAAAWICDVVAAGWGANGKLRGRDREVVDILRRDKDVMSFRLLQDGAPEHPLYIPSEVKNIGLVLYRRKFGADTPELPETTETTETTRP